VSAPGLQPVECRICSAASQPLSTARILARYDIGYFRCPSCGFVQTEKPYWLKESYSEAINRTDVGLVRRNIEHSRMLRVLIPLLADPAKRFLDYGGGYGMLVRLMRDQGFDFRWQDAHCENLFAQDFGSEPGSKYEMLTAFEVIEHLEDPRAGLREMLDCSDMVLLGTYLLPEPCPKPGDWWYYSLEHGQHISFQSHASLQALAAGAGAQLYSNGINLHLVSRRPVQEARFRFAAGRRAAWLAPFFKRKSLLQDDFAYSLQKQSSEAAKP
jgi:hypothetical protein